MTALRTDSWRRWLDRRGGRRRAVECGELSGIDHVVVIPVLAEGTNLVQTLESLASNAVSELDRTLVLCVVNNRPAPFARADQIDDNRTTLQWLRRLVGAKGSTEGPLSRLRPAVIDAASPGLELGPKMGVGEARRIGLDAALEILAAGDRPDGLLISLDADTVVEPEYLAAVTAHFERSGAGAGVIAYAHPLPEDPARRQAIVLYELFLRYHELGLRRAASPYAWPTIGSTIVVRGGAYVAAGGMNRRQAGEDFYFIQQLVKTGSLSRIDSTTVRPSDRVSDRVPFGTGAGIGRHLRGDRGLFRLYHPDSYRILGSWLTLVRHRIGAPAEALLEGAAAIEPELAAFLSGRRFPEVWPRLRENAPDLTGLLAQFHRWFDGFATLKLMHHLRDHGFPPMAVEEAYRALFENLDGVDEAPAGDPEGLLEAARAACRRGRVPPLAGG